jgi:hypothetical protein
MNAVTVENSNITIIHLHRKRNDEFPLTILEDLAEVRLDT